jgi:hypothetical protein
MYSLGVRPALIREPEASTGGAAFEVEVWELPLENVGCVPQFIGCRAEFLPA